MRVVLAILMSLTMGATSAALAQGNGAGTAESDADIAILTASIAIPSVDRATGLIQVLEVVTVTNQGSQAFAGSLLADPEKGGVLKLTLPRDALDVSLGDGFGDREPLPTAEGLLTRNPVPPGQSILVYAYKLPFTTDAYTLERTFSYPVQRVNFLIASGGPSPSSPQLTDVKTVTVGSASNFSLSGQGFKPGDPVTIRLSGLPPLVPPGSVGSGASLDTVLRGSGIGLMAVEMALLSLYGVRGGRRRSLAVAAAGASEMKELETERQLLVGSIAGMDDAFAAGALSREECERPRQVVKQRLTDVMLLIRERAATQRGDRGALANARASDDAAPPPAPPGDRVEAS